MCGIVGFFNNNTNPEQINKIIENMNNTQIHRGPNSTDKFINDEKNLGLMMCRLSILDLDFGKQPMHSEDKRYTIIFNGTIINSPELRKGMEEKGIKFFTKNSDTEVLLKMLISRGVDCLKILNGSFAFAFYDNKNKKLICARDRFGLKPFYYLYKNNTLLFASELKAILNSGYSSKSIDKQSLFHYLSLLWVPGSDTIIKDIKKLPPGFFFETDLKSGTFKLSKWWDLNFNPDYSLKKEDWPKKILSVLTTSVKRSTLSDVPLSCALSGGLDSQSIIGILSKINKSPSSFSLGFEGYDEGNLNELGVSRYAAKHFGTKHEEILIGKEEYFKDLNKMVYHLDEPYGGGLPLWHVLKNAGNKFGVILTGLGGDELFGNFGRWTLLEKTFFLTFKSKFHFKSLFFDRKYFFSDELKKKLIINNQENFLDTSEFLYSFIYNKKNKSMKDKIAYLDIKTQLPDEYCNMVDKFSMAHGIEARAPFLDNELTDLIQTIPSEYRTSPKDFKYLLRESVKDILPPKNLYNKKIGFVGLESQKINYNFHKLKNILFETRKIKKQEIFNEKFLETFLSAYEEKNYFNERKNFNLVNKIYSYKSLWAIIMFQVWYDIFIEKDYSFNFD